MTFTTAAFDRSSSCDCRPRRALLHLSYSSAPLHADGAFVTHDPERNLGHRDRQKLNTSHCSRVTAALAASFLHDQDSIRTSASLTGVRAPALAGLAVTPLPATAIGPGLRIHGELEGLPPLPDLEFAIFEKPQPGSAIAALSAAIAWAHAPGSPFGSHLNAPRARWRRRLIL